MSHKKLVKKKQSNIRNAITVSILIFILLLLYFIRLTINSIKNNKNVKKLFNMVVKNTSKKIKKNNEYNSDTNKVIFTNLNAKQIDKMSDIRWNNNDVIYKFSSVKLNKMQAIQKKVSDMTIENIKTEMQALIKLLVETQKIPTEDIKYLPNNKLIQRLLYSENQFQNLNKKEKLDNYYYLEEWKKEFKIWLSNIYLDVGYKTNTIPVEINSGWMLNYINKPDIKIPQQKHLADNVDSLQPNIVNSTTLTNSDLIRI